MSTHGMCFIVNAKEVEDGGLISVDLEEEEKVDDRKKNNAAEGEVCLGVFPFLDSEEDDNLILTHLIARHELDELMDLEWPQRINAIAQTAFRRGYLAGKGILKPNP